jgi:hypothetical protein
MRHSSVQIERWRFIGNLATVMDIGPRFENCCDKITIALAFLFRAQLIRFRCVLFSNAFLTPPEIRLKMRAALCL